MPRQGQPPYAQPEDLESLLAAAFLAGAFFSVVLLDSDFAPELFFVSAALSGAEVLDALWAPFW